MERFAWMGRIKPGMREEYKRRHDGLLLAENLCVRQCVHLRVIVRAQKEKPLPQGRDGNSSISMAFVLFLGRT